MPSFPSLSPRAFAALAVASAVGFCGCSSTAPQGLDRAVASAQAGILRRFPDEDLSRLRLRQIELLDRNVATGRTYRVQFEDVSSIVVVTNGGVRTRSVRFVDAQVAPDGRVLSANESAPRPARKVKR